MFNTKQTLVVASVTALFSGSVFAMSGSSDSNTEAGEKINGKYAANYAEIIKEGARSVKDGQTVKILESEKKSLSRKILNLNNLRDVESDKKVNKNTMIVKMGFQNGKKYHY